MKKDYFNAIQISFKLTTNAKPFWAIEAGDKIYSFMYHNKNVTAYTVGAVGKMQNADGMVWKRIFWGGKNDAEFYIDIYPESTGKDYIIQEESKDSIWASDQAMVKEFAMNYINAEIEDNNNKRAEAIKVYDENVATLKAKLVKIQNNL